MNIIVVQNPSGSAVPSGSILFWNGTSANIPEGWTLYDSPADAFIMGATVANLTKQGAANHSHTNATTGASGAHTHTLSATVANNTDKIGAIGQGVLSGTGTHSHGLPSASIGAVLTNHQHTVNDTNPTDNLPPYCRYFLMKCAGAKVPVGAIAMWFDTLAKIPSGWRHCNGSTADGITVPDIRGRFIYIPSSSANQGTTGGSALHGHTNPADTNPNGAHTHSLASGSLASTNSLSIWDGSFEVIFARGNHTHTGISGTSGNDPDHVHTFPTITPVELLPPYIKLYYMMKVY